MSHMLDAIEDMLTVGLSKHQVCVGGGEGEGGGGGAYWLVVEYRNSHVHA